MNGRKNQPKISSQSKKIELDLKLEELKNKKLEEKTIQRAFAIGVPHINLKGIPITPEALKTISEEEAKQLQVVPFLRDEKIICLGAIDPLDQKLLELKNKIEDETNLSVNMFLVSEVSFLIGLKFYQTLPKIKKREGGLEITEEELLNFQTKIKTFDDLQQEIKKSAAPKIIILIIAAAIKSRSSDIHFESEEQNVKIRLRVDGVLHDASFLPKNIWSEVVSRIKLLSSLKINITNQPQDGRFSIFFSGKKIDVRVSVLPSTHGESIVIRLLMFEQKISLESLGLNHRYLEDFKKEINKPNGMIITTGPTGSGKTTTLYAILDYLNNPETKIITLEEPVEYELSGATQISIDTSKDQNFAKMFRSIMRQDPDVVMVGEIRDQETAEVSVQAALTGHLVFSTLHTNDAAGAIPRFLILGVKPYLLAPALNLIIAQRLVRKICQNCKEKIEMDQDLLTKVKKILEDLPEQEKSKIDLNHLEFYHGHGCEACQGIGYKERIGIFEFFSVDSKIEEIILKTSASEREIKDVLKKKKMVTMVQDGILKALKGMTTIDEVFRVAD